MKRLLFRLAALGLGLLFTVGVVEIGGRFVRRGPTQAPRSVAVREAHRGPGHLPHHRTSPAPDAGARRFRILVLGDSFSWGAGVFPQDAYPQRLENLLERMAGGALDVELDTYTRPGWNTVQEVRALGLQPPETPPDLVLLGYCLNDTERARREGNDDIALPLLRRTPEGPAGTLYELSFIYRRIWDRLETRRQRRAFDRYYHELYEREGWQAAQASLDTLRALASGWQAPVVAVIFPIFDQQLDGRYVYADLHRRIGAAMRERGFSSLDLLSAYEGVDAQRLAVEPFTDPHPNELAHRIASQTLAQYLLDEGLVPIDPSAVHPKDIDLTVSSERDAPQ